MSSRSAFAHSKPLFERRPANLPLTTLPARLDRVRIPGPERSRMSQVSTIERKGRDGEADRVVSARAVQRIVIFLTMLSSAVAFVEPSPFEIMFMVMALVFLSTRLSFSVLLAPLVALLALYNLGGLIALVPYTHDERAVMFILISIYLAAAGLVFAAVMLDDTAARLKMIETGWVAAGVIASLAGILGYFNIGGLGSVFSFNDRASGTFKDPNVLGVYLVFPFVTLALGFMQGRRRHALARAKALTVIAAAIFLSFSRGAWGVAALAGALAVFLAFVTSRSNIDRARIVFVSVAAVGALVGMILVILSIPEVRDLFLQRFSLEQRYDVQAGGRFDNQARALPMLLDLPNGFGPYQFRFHFPEDPHNVYINGFASYGWLGGLAYLALTLVTLVIGWRGALMRSSVQPMLIAAWSCLFLIILQGFTIDTDHWRHYYVLLGMVWGLHAVAMRERTSGVRR
jgi:O-antigen ligase